MPRQMASTVAACSSKSAARRAAAALVSERPPAGANSGPLVVAASAVVVVVAIVVVVVAVILVVALELEQRHRRARDAGLDLDAIADLQRGRELEAGRHDDVEGEVADLDGEGSGRRVGRSREGRARAVELDLVDVACVFPVVALE